jgi:hypothetical protein
MEMNLVAQDPAVVVSMSSAKLLIVGDCSLANPNEISIFPMFKMAQMSARSASRVSNPAKDRRV